ncbi:aspartate aminotransferase family protein [Balneolaceae bacterium YR4-1]|uniref:Aspartate aminotransferase family protein n=1 Tax=Halalkalibaculum roseum TaxID=2709311 RepID=A0A6M1TA17_9BACT|nr:aminotransferase class III-fold pyridoxal phosphate-dependent enzyme [Halalkalibaculum roseum]NGP77083.1 aspartate aminotransferase family protein [Halalkalibaculum roseum]
MPLFDVYPLLDITPEKGEDCFVYDTKGTKYLDFYGGHAVISIGHSHPHFRKRIKEQVDKLAFYSNSVLNPLQTQLAEKLGNLSGYEEYQLFLSNSGAEAVENALKVASFYTGKKKVISFSKSFHGRTSAALGVTDNSKYSAPINENDHTVFLELNETEALTKEINKGDVCAVIIEGIQGIGGIHIPDPEFMKQIELLCKKHGALFICDEIQSGYGRSGKFFAHQHAGVTPDIITMAKGMGNGFPIAGTLFHPKIEPWHGELGSTFGGNHLACAAGLAVLEVISDEQLIDNANIVGNSLMEKLAGLPMVTEVRGEGLMIGVECTNPIKEIRMKLLHEKHILTGVSSDPHTLRLLPPLTISKDQADKFVTDFQHTLTAISKNETLYLS